VFQRLSYLLVALAKYTSGLFFILSVLSLGSVYISRLPNTDQCIQLITNDFSDADYLGLVDLVSGRYEVDQRPNSQPFLNLPSPDGKWVLMFQWQNSTPDVYTYLLQSLDNQSRIVLQENVPREASTNLFPLAVSPHFKWSPDSQFLAYIWKDQNGQSYLSMVRIEDGEHKTIPFSRIDAKTVSPTNAANFSSNTTIQGWSGDGQYLSIAERTGLSFQVSIWRMRDLQRVLSAFDERIVFQGMWLSEGNRYAGVTGTNNLEDEPANLILYDPVEQQEVTVVELPKRQVRLLSSSPNNDYLALTSVVEHCDADTCKPHWQHELFNTDGDPVSPVFLSSPLTESDTPDRLVYVGVGAGSVYSRETLTGLWSGDGQTWVFLQKADDGLDLFRFDLTTQQSQQIASQVSPEWFEALLPSVRLWEVGFQSYGAIPMLRVSDQLLVPTQSNNTLRIDLLDIPSNRQTLLLEGAANLITDQENNFFGSIWNWENEWLAIPWTTSDEKTQLTLARTDGSRVDTIDKGLETIAFVRWLDQHWIAYLAKGVTAGIEALNVETQISKPLLQAVEELSYWNVFLMPETNVATVNLSTDRGNSELWLIGLDGGLRRQLNIEPGGFSTWSPDSSQVAYLSGRTYRDRQLEIFDVRQNLLRQIPLKRQFTGRPRIQAWTKCY
jgi:Tol biopolymer transport system component